ncbi:hypothetical protein [Streptomyces sp. NPDC050704]|uniref:hypothetical protein n=1 Tax=Streptomyces sp. NPDC050704 TaxID=3157219 RepID=UPI003443530B
MRATLSAAVAACAVMTVLPGAASAEPAGVAGDLEAGVERISVAADGTQADDNSVGASVTPDGRSIVFSSSAKNLTPDAPTAGDRVFVRDQQTSQTKRLGAQTPIGPPVISGDGEYVAYPIQWMRNTRIRLPQVSTGREISTNCWYSCTQPSMSTDGHSVAHAVTISKLSSRVEVENWYANTKEVIVALDHNLPSRPSISGDGRYVAYEDGKREDVFVRDRTSGTTSGPLDSPSQWSTLVQLSDDGSKVVYFAGSDTYVYDMGSGTTQLVPNVRGVAIDPTGRYLLYAPHDANGASLTLRDLETGTDEIVSNQPASAGTDAVSAGGRDVVFQSTADDIVPGDTNGKSDVFVRHFY